MKAIGYIRVSTEKQKDAGVSLDAQRASILEYCQTHDIELLDVLSDPGESGTSLTDRPEAVRAIALACQHKASLVAYSLSRLFRNTIEALQNLDTLEAAGARLASITELVDTSTAAGRFTVTIFFARDEWEARAIGERTSTALRHKARTGQRVSKNATYGHRLAVAARWDEKKKRDVIDQEIDPVESRAVDLICELRSKKYSRQAIGRKLFALGHKSRSGTVLSSKTIGKILERRGLK